MTASRAVAAAVYPKRKPRVLIVDDDLITSDELRQLLDGDGYTCERASNGAEALQAIELRPFDVVVSDIRMEGMSGLDLLDHLNRVHPHLPVILCTGYSALAGAVDATKRGAYQYLEKPYDLTALEDVLASAVRERPSFGPALAKRHATDLTVTRARGRAAPAIVEAAVVPVILGNDPSMCALQRSITSVASSNAPVLILGESGTGKDLVARAIHAAGDRRDRPFVAVNVSAIPEHLLESEMFGHVRGAFTGASDARRGLLLEADGGTLFLDEIGDMPIALQAKLLRVLQSGEMRPVGSDSTRGVDVRILSATHRDLPSLIEAGRFRQDLYFRLHVLPIRVPPLRDRRADIVNLARHFLARAQGRTPTSPVRMLGADAERILANAWWPGNVRELESTMERLVVFGREKTIHAADLFFLDPTSAAAGNAADVTGAAEGTELITLRDVSERHVSNVLAATNGDKRRAAEILGVDISTLYRWQQRPRVGRAGVPQ